MRYKFLIFLLLLLPTVNANVIVEFPVNLSFFVNEQASFRFSINNTNDFDIYNVTFTPKQGFTFPTIDRINKGESHNFTASAFLTSATLNSGISTKLEYFFYTRQNSNPQIHSILLSNSLIDPANITIRSGDTIKWVNAESSTLTVKSLDQSFEIEVQSNTAKDQNFNGVQNVEYFIKENGLKGYLNVISNQEDILTHDPSKDVNLNFNYASKYKEGSFEVEILTPEFSMNYTEVSEGAIRLKSNREISNLRVRSDPPWIRFSQDNFNFDGTKIITFSIKPIINSTNDTNKDYNLKIVFESDNANKVEKELKVHVNYANVIDIDLASLPPFQIISETMLRALCLKYPESCPTKNQTVIQFLNVTTNLTEEVILLGEKTQRIDNSINLQKESIDSIIGGQSKFQETLTKISEILTSIDETSKKEYESGRRRSVIITFFGVLFVVLGGIGSVVFSIKAKRYRSLI